MHRSTVSLLKLAFVGIALALACGPQPIDVPEDGDDEDNDRGGSSGTGASGGNLPTGGFSGTAPTGGFSGTAPTGGFGGTVSTGGFSGSVGIGGTATGGTAGTFPQAGTAGTFPQGGTGVGGSGAGAPPGGGSGGGATAMCDAAFVADPDGFVRAPGASGCLHGYAFSGGDTGSMLTTSTSFAMCGTPCALRVAGTLGAATMANSYAGVVYLGFNVNQTAGSTVAGTLVPTGTGLQVTYTKISGPATIRVQIQAGANRWCANLTTNPAIIPYTSFNTMCWETVPPATGAYAKQPIEAIQLVAPGGETAVPIDMTLVSVKDM